MKSDQKFIIFVKKSDVHVKKRRKVFGQMPRKTFGEAESIHGVGEVEVSPGIVQANLLEFVRMLEKIVPDLKERKNGFLLNGFDVEVGIDGKGKVGFMGTGTEVGGHAIFTLRFERPA